MALTGIQRRDGINPISFSFYPILNLFLIERMDVILRNKIYIILGPEYKNVASKICNTYDFVKHIEKISHLSHIDYFNLDLLIVNRTMIKNKSDEEFLLWLSRVKMIPVVLMVNTDKEAQQSLDMKCFDFIRKPAEYNIFKFKLDNYISMLDNEKYAKTMQNRLYEAIEIQHRAVKRLNDSLYGILFDVMEVANKSLAQHNFRTKEYIEIFINHLVSKQNMYQTEVVLWDKESYIKAAHFHDIGKIFLPVDSDNKDPDTLKKEIAFGLKLMEKLKKRNHDNDYLDITKRYIETQYECWDGSGYPNGLSKEDIPLEGRILAICNAYDDKCHSSQYYHLESHEKAMEEINRESGKRFDPELVHIMNTVSDEFKVIGNRHRILFEK